MVAVVQGVGTVWRLEGCLCFPTPVCTWLSICGLLCEACAWHTVSGTRPKCQASLLQQGWRTPLCSMRWRALSGPPPTSPLSPLLVSPNTANVNWVLTSVQINTVCAKRPCNAAAGPGGVLEVQMRSKGAYNKVHAPRKGFAYPTAVEQLHQWVGRFLNGSVRRGMREG